MSLRIGTTSSDSGSPASRSSKHANSNQADQPDRRTSIILAAEQLFAEHGYASVSLRDIAQKAQVPLALVGYYFGPKHELFHAIFERWSDTVQARLSGLEAARKKPLRGRLTAIIQAFVQPVLLLRASAEGEYYALLVARELSHRSKETERALEVFFDPLANAYIDALHEALPGRSRAQVAWAYQFSLGALLHHIIDERVVRLSKGQAINHDPAVGRGLVAFISHGIRGALPYLPNKKVRRRPP